MSNVYCASWLIAAADRITTPTLIIHSENDLRCPIGQAEQLFEASRCFVGVRVGQGVPV